jgi:hypothetical protein
MKWGRDFFRAWFALSAIWIGFSVYSFGTTTYRLPWLWQGPRIALDFSTPSQAHVEFDPSKSQADLEEDVSRAMKRVVDQATDRQAADAAMRSFAETRDKLLASINEKYEEQEDRAWAVWLLTLTPPAVMLAVCFGIAWILRGSRAAPSNARCISCANWDRHPRSVS